MPRDAQGLEQNAAPLRTTSPRISNSTQKKNMVLFQVVDYIHERGTNIGVNYLKFKILGHRIELYRPNRSYLRGSCTTHHADLTLRTRTQHRTAASARNALRSEHGRAIFHSRNQVRHSGASVGQ